MTDEFKRFLASGPDVVRERDRKAQEAQDEYKAAQKREADARQVLEQNWESAKKLLVGVVSEINAAFADVGLEIRIREEQNPKPALARLGIGLYRHGVFTGDGFELHVTDKGKQFFQLRGGDKRSLAPLPLVSECTTSDYQKTLQSFVGPVLPEL